MSEKLQAEPAKCMNCGGGKFEWGWMHERGVNRPMLFSKGREGWILGLVGRPVNSRRCLGCNHIAFFCDAERGPWPRFSLLRLFIITTVVAIGAALITLAARGIR